VSVQSVYDQHMKDAKASKQKFSKRETAQRMEVSLRAAFKMPQTTRSEKKQQKNQIHAKKH
jgi:hypothetical protein